MGVVVWITGAAMVGASIGAAMVKGVDVAAGAKSLTGGGAIDGSSGAVSLAAGSGSATGSGATPLLVRFFFLLLPFISMQIAAIRPAMQQVRAKRPKSQRKMVALPPSDPLLLLSKDAHELESPLLEEVLLLLAFASWSTAALALKLVGGIVEGKKLSKAVVDTVWVGAA